MKKFLLSTTGRLLIGCLAVIIVAGIIIVAVESMKKKRGTNETTEVALQENSETSVQMSDLPKEETTYAESEAETSESIVTGISQVESNTSTTTETSENTQEPAKPSETSATTSPENLSEDDLYYQNNTTVIKVIKANESTDVQTEAEVAEVLKELGFDQYPITYDYSMGGEYTGEKEITEDPNIKRPMYATSFISDSGNLYTIYMVNGVIAAFPVSFNMESDLEAELLISESDKLTIYSSDTDKFFVTIPNKSEAIVKVIEKINAESLNKLTNEEIRDYEN
jgi:hypothetical protein